MSIEIKNGGHIDASGMSGTYYLHVKAIDKVANVSTKVSNAFVIEGDKPILSVSMNGNTNLNTKYSTTISAKDEGVGIKEVLYKWTTTEDFPSDESTFKTTSDGSSVTTPTGEDYYYLHLKAYDKNGNWTTLTTKPFNLFPYSFSETYDGIILNTYKGSKTTLVLPSEFNGKPVTETDSSFLHYNTSITSIEIPGSIKRLSGFFSMTNLHHIKINSGVEYIGGTAFNASSPQSDIIIPGTVKTIDTNTFKNMTPSSSVKLILEEGIETIGNSAFNASKFTGSVTIPDSVETIGSSAFRNATFSTVYIGSGVYSMGNYAFDSKTLTTVYNYSGYLSLTASKFPTVKKTVSVYNY